MTAKEDSMYELPLIRFDNRAFLEKLKQGELFMFSNLHYQSMEGEDETRGDYFDGSIPLSSIKQAEISLIGRVLRHPRMMTLGVFIKCFTECSVNDFVKLNDRLWLLSFSEETKNAIRGFNVDSALIIGSPNKFLKQVRTEAEKKNKSFCAGSVEYLTDEELCRVERGILSGQFRNVSLIKRDAYKDQKEYRICIRHRPEGVSFEDKIQDIPKGITDLPYTMSIGEIQDAYIVPIETILSEGIIIDIETGDYLIRDDENRKDSEVAQ